MTNPSIQIFDNDDDRFLDTLLETIIHEIEEWNKTHQEKMSESMQQEIIQRHCDEAACEYEEDQLFEIDDWVTTLLSKREKK